MPFIRGEKIGVTDSSLGFVLSWLKNLGITDGGVGGGTGDQRSALTESNFIEHMKNGLVLTKLVETLVSGTTLKVNQRPYTKTPCITNIELGLAVIWKENISPTNMCSAEDFYRGDAVKVIRCMLEVFCTLQVQPLIKRSSKQVLRELDTGLKSVGRSLSRSTLTRPFQLGSHIVADFSDGTRIIAILAILGKISADDVANFWGVPLTKEQKYHNAEALVAILKKVRCKCWLSPRDWLMPPDPCPESLFYMLHIFHHDLRISDDNTIWWKNRPKLKDFVFKDSIPLVDEANVGNDSDSSDLGDYNMDIMDGSTVGSKIMNEINEMRSSAKLEAKKSQSTSNVFQKMGSSTKFGKKASNREIVEQTRKDKEHEDHHHQHHHHRHHQNHQQNPSADKTGGDVIAKRYSTVLSKNRASVVSQESHSSRGSKLYDGRPRQSVFGAVTSTVLVSESEEKKREQAQKIREDAERANAELRKKKQSVSVRLHRKSQFMQSLSESTPTLHHPTSESKDMLSQGQSRTDSRVSLAPIEEFNNVSGERKSILRNKSSGLSTVNQRNANLMGGTHVARPTSRVYVVPMAGEGEPEQVEDQLVGQFLTRIDGLVKKLEEKSQLPSHWEKRARQPASQSMDNFLDFGYTKDFGSGYHDVWQDLRSSSPYLDALQGRAYSAPLNAADFQTPNPAALQSRSFPGAQEWQSPGRNQHVEQQRGGLLSKEPEAKRAEYVPSREEEMSQLHREDVRRLHELSLLEGPNLLASTSSRAPTVLPPEDIDVYAPGAAPQINEVPQPDVPVLIDSKEEPQPDSEKVEPTTSIEASVVCANGSTWLAAIQTNVVEYEASGTAEAAAAEDAKFVLDFNVFQQGTKKVLVRVDVGHIIDVKTTAGAEDGTGLQYFIVLNSQGILKGSEAEGIQDLPDGSAKVLHVSGIISYYDARNFFAELLILARFLSQGSDPISAHSPMVS